MQTATHSQIQTKQDGQTDKDKINEVIFTVGIMVTLTIVVQLIINYFYLDEVATTIAGKETVVSALKTENSRLLNIQSNHSKLIVDSAKAENDYRELQSLIPQKAEQPQILIWLSEEARLRGLKLESFQENSLPQNVQQKMGQLQQVSIKAIVSGDQSQITKLLVDFSRHERIFLVESIRLSEKEKNKDSTEVTSHTAEIIFSAFLGTDNGKLHLK